MFSALAVDSDGEVWRRTAKVEVVVVAEEVVEEAVEAAEVVAVVVVVEEAHKDSFHNVIYDHRLHNGT